MTTASDIVSSALKMIGVVDANTTVDATDAEDGLTKLNDMIQSWAAKSVYTGAPVLALADEFPFEDHHVLGVKAMLAVQLAPDYQKEAPPLVQRNAREGWSAIFSDFFVDEKTPVDLGLQGMPSQRWWAR
jgi:hypothetical protein